MTQLKKLPLLKYKTSIVTTLSTLTNILKGYETFIVGGAVRTLYMLEIGQLEVSDTDDIDFVTSATPTQIAKCIQEYNLAMNTKYGIKEVGDAFGVVLLSMGEDTYEIATMRVDSNQDGRHTDVEFTTDLKTDLERRDFTMNALVLNASGEILDPLGYGKKDIEEKLVATVHYDKESFEQDYLRILRAARFAARYDYNIPSDNLRAMKKLKDELMKHITIERIVMEFDKAFQDTKPGRFIKILDSVGIFTLIFPEYEHAEVFLQNPIYHPEGDVLTHICNVVDRADPSIRWEAMLHDVGKPKAAKRHKNWDKDKPETQFFSFYDHDNIGAYMVGKICERLKLSTLKTDSIYIATKYHMRMYTVKKEAKKRRMSLQIYKRAKTFERYRQFNKMLSLLGPADVEQNRIEEKIFIKELSDIQNLPIPSGKEIIEHLKLPDEDLSKVSVIHKGMYSIWSDNNKDLPKESYLSYAEKKYAKLKLPTEESGLLMTILRGIPGSGKSTYANYINTNDVKHARTFSADQYFIDRQTKEYLFKPSMLRSAHNSVMIKAEAAVFQGVKHIIIDNTNTQLWEYQKFIWLAERHNYRIQIVTFYHDETHPEVYAERNIHGVPEEKIKEMMKRFESPASAPGPDIIQYKPAEDLKR